MKGENRPTVVVEGVIGSVDGEHGYLSRCLCGREYPPWDIILNIYPDMPVKMGCCGRWLYMKVETSVLESKEVER